MKKFILSAAALLILTSGFASAQATNARVRVVHASPDAPAVDITVNGNPVLEALPFREYSEYLSLPAGAYSFGIRVTGTSTVVATLPATPGDTAPEAVSKRTRRPDFRQTRGADIP